MKTWKSWLVVSLCLACFVAAFAASDWPTDQHGQGYGYDNHPHPHH